MNDVEISTGVDADGTPKSIILRFTPQTDEGDIVIFDTPAEARDWADGVEEEARSSAVQDPALFEALQDIRDRADDMEAALANPSDALTPDEWTAVRKRPVEVEAKLYTGDEPGVLATREGEVEVTPGEIIMRGVAGELYPCDPDIFDQTYEVVEG